MGLGARALPTKPAWVVDALNFVVGRNELPLSKASDFLCSPLFPSELESTREKHGRHKREEDEDTMPPWI